MSLAQYHAKLAEWRKTYGVPPPPRVFSLTVGSIACVKAGCGTTKRTQRHHTGDDFWFAILLPDVYAARYIQFHPDDIAYVCPDHHKAVHKIYKRIRKEVWAELNEHGQSVITKEWCDKWKEEYRAAFKRWTRQPARKRKRRKKRKKQV